MHWLFDNSYEQILDAQRELRESAARAQLLAKVRREAAAERPATSGPLGIATRLLRAALTRP
ncbi:MAG TPA: hypothetical protein VGO86_08455 [Candidatus Dormibacteraeota bacterium]